LICDEEAADATRLDGGCGADSWTGVVVVAVFDGELVPTELIAETWYAYVVLGDSPVLEYVVVVEPVLDTIVFQVEPLLVDLSIWYPVKSKPPRFEGVFQDKLIWEVDTAWAVRFVGGLSKMGNDKASAVETVEENINKEKTSTLENTRYCFFTDCR